MKGGEESSYFSTVPLQCRHCTRGSFMHACEINLVALNNCIISGLWGLRPPLQYRHCTLCFYACWCHLLYLPPYSIVTAPMLLCMLMSFIVYSICSLLVIASCLDCEGWDLPYNIVTVGAFMHGPPLQYRHCRCFYAC